MTQSKEPCNYGSHASWHRGMGHVGWNPGHYVFKTEIRPEIRLSDVFGWKSGLEIKVGNQTV